MLYLLGDGIYQVFHLFLKAIKSETNMNERRFSSNEEAALEDMEQFFGVIEGRVLILRWDIRS